MLLEDVASTAYADLLAKKEKIRARMAELSSNGNDDVQVLPGTKEVHWDNVMKEMKWLADDFQKERQRHIANAKKLTKAVDTFHKTKDARKMKKSKDETVALKKISSKISRDVRKFWLKINKVVAFKQKIDSDEVRQKAMDKHLVFLVKQTERYTNMLAENMHASCEQDDEDERSVASGRRFSQNSSVASSPVKPRAQSSTEARHAKRKASPEGCDGAKRTRVDNDLTMSNGYDSGEEAEGSNIASEDEDDEFEFEEEQDDETTLIEEEQARARERARRRGLNADEEGSEAENGSDQEEVALLQVEGDMPIEQLRAMYANMPAYDSEEENGSEESNHSDTEQPAHSAPTLKSAPPKAIESDEEDADEDFEPDDEQDDETTLIEEEQARARERARRAAQSGSASTSVEEVLSDQEEIALLKAEGEMSIEELRAMYANMPAYDSDEDEAEEGEGGGSEEEFASDADEQSTRPSAAPSSTSASDEPLTKAALSVGVSAAANGSNGEEQEMEVVDEEDQDADFEFEDEQDDETTLIEEEQARARERARRRAAAGGDVDGEDDGGGSDDEEIALLKAEGEMSIEELRAMYANMPAYDSDDDEEEENGEEFGSERGESDADTIEATHSTNTAPVNPTTVGSDTTKNGASSEGNDEDGDDDADFEPENEEDDETTLIEEEQARARERAKRRAANGEEGEEASGSDDEEIALLKAEGEMSIEQLRAMYADMPAYDSEEENDEEESEDEEFEGAEEPAHTAPSSSAVVKTSDEDADDEDADEDFEPDDEQDDETTLIEEEQARARERAKRRGAATDDTETGGSDDEEIALLKAEGEMSIEELRAMYANMPAYDSNEDEEGEEGEEFGEESMEISDEEAPRRVTFESPPAKRSSRHNSSAEQVYEEDEGEPMEEVESSACLESKDNAGDEENRDDNKLAAEGEDYDVEDAIHRLEAADLAARSIRVDRPFALSKKITLREYQHIGLNWLVSLNERRLNGILADEMGLGKTIQTISLLAYLAVHKGIWGPHLIIVPTSCLVNWETELKKFCPMFKVLTYFGSAKKRKFLRSGWSKLNSFHICITSYQIVVQDSNAFRRKRWYYMILDEAHNIKNFKSKRWQTLLNYNTQRRLLLTGTPLQNNLMELWSLMHFLMPHIFRSRKEFSYWFSNPLSGMVEGNRGVNNDLIGRLHSIMRPFLLRRLKKDVAKQLPGKFEHIVMCRLSKRQLHLYEEFMSRSTTKSSLTGGGFLGMMNILMQLRKVCNHPDLFEPRPITSPFAPASVTYRSPALVVRALDQGPLTRISPGMLEFWSFDRDSLATQALSELQVPRELFVQVEDVSLPGSNVSNKPQIQLYAEKLRAVLQAQVEARQAFNYHIMQERCTKPNLPYSWRLVRAVSMVPFTTLVGLARHCHRARREITPCWFDLIKSVDDRVAQSADMVAHFVFVLPKVVTSGIQIVSPGCQPSWQDQMLLQYGAQLQKSRNFMRQTLAPFYPALMRQRIFFPDRKLIQFDSGKLQTLAVLLRDLKKGGHKCLIFTQMSKMLDILEIFLNLHDHTFVRLDGSTSIDRRQKLMDRFNSDPKLFVFILSTRSGGLGINLTGADTVIFYDTDWNPAMDAQAQDRAHRIGQTREVHIYRLVSESTVEENILTKAKQKRHLDFLVMTEGNFSEASLFSAKGMKDILGVDSVGASDAVEDVTDATNPGSSANIEAAMAAAEDEEDVRAMKNAALEATKDMDEFDEAAVVEPGADDDGEGAAEAAAASAAVVVAEDPGAEEKDMEKEFASWQASLGPDFKALEAALKPIERYALRIRTEIEPYYSIFYITEQARLEALDMGGGEGETWNVEEIEKEKEEEEMRALQEGELLATNVTQRDINRHRTWFLQERARRVAARRMRNMTGGAWSMQLENGIPYWYNSDTGEAMYQTPAIILEQERLQWARERGYNAMPINIMLHIFSYLLPYPERCAVAPLCARWAEAANHVSFRKRVLPVESGARDPTKRLTKLVPNVYASIEEALKESLPGDTIELGMGHHWEGSLLIDKPTRLLCESGGGDDCSKCVIELTGQVQVTPTARAAVFYGITLRRPRKVYRATSCILAKDSSLSIFNCVVNNDGAKGSAVCVIGAPWLRIGNTQVLSGTSGVHAVESSVLITDSVISENSQSGVVLVDSECCVEDTFITKNARFAVQCVSGTELVVLRHCDLRPARTGGSLFSVVDFEPAEPGVECGKNIYTQMCVTDTSSEEELRKFPWHTVAKVSVSKSASKNSLDETRALSYHQQGIPMYDDAEMDYNYFEDYTIPQGAASSSKKRVRL